MPTTAGIPISRATSEACAAIVPVSVITAAANTNKGVASLDPALQAAFATELGDEARRAHRDERIQMTEGWLESITAGMDPGDRRRLVELAVVLASSATVHSFDVLLVASPARAADVVAWAIRSLALGKADA